MTTFKCSLCGSIWTEGATRNYNKDEVCRKCLKVNQEEALAELLECQKHLGGGEMQRLNKYIKTNEDWYPAYSSKQDGNPFDHTAAFVIADRDPKTGLWSVGVCGLDDFGCEKHNLRQVEAKELFDSIKDFITISQLKMLGLHFY